MALAGLLDELTRRSEAEVAALRAAAGDEAGAIAAAATRRMAERRSAALGAREQTLRDAAEQAVAAAARDARRAELEARARLLDRVFAAAGARLPSAASSPAYLAGLPARLTEAIAYLGDQPGGLRCHPALVTAVRRLTASRPDLTTTSDSVGTGFLLESADQRLAIDGTLEGALARDRADLALLAWRTLEGSA